MKSGRGGKRKGAGRPLGTFSKEKRKKDTITLLPRDWDRLDKIGPSRGKAVQKALDYYWEHVGV